MGISLPRQKCAKSVKRRYKEKQISPLRCAPVEMTSFGGYDLASYDHFWDNSAACFAGEFSGL